MEELFTILSASARFKKAKKPRKEETDSKIARQQQEEVPDDDGDQQQDEEEDVVVRSRDRTGKRATNNNENAKLQLIHKEEILAFRRSMGIRLAKNNKHDPTIPDPLSSFQELAAPSWWSNVARSTTMAEQQQQQQLDDLFQRVNRVVQRNIEVGRWKEPTPIQMQAIPAVLHERRDLIGAAPTGSGKSGAFIIPALFLSSAPNKVFYGDFKETANSEARKDEKKKQDMRLKSSLGSRGRQGDVRTLLLAPSLELAAQLHREVERLGAGLPGGLSSLLLSKSNSAQAIKGEVGGKDGLDVLVSTPLRLVDCLEKGMKLGSVRMVVIDEADRLLDAADGDRKKPFRSGDESDDDNVALREKQSATAASGSSHSKSFLAQMDTILSDIPATAVRALFSATITPTVRSISEAILRNPIDMTIMSSSSSPGGANPDIEQELVFCGREEGKLLAIRQIVQRGQLRPPVIVFVQSQERAQALFSELLYDGLHIDVIHAGRSKSARENAVAKFRRGDTWILICTDLVARGVDFRAVNMVINYDLPSNGVTYIHRIGRTGRAGRKGKAITFHTEMDFDNLRTIANIMKQSGCQVEDWMLNMSRSSGHDRRAASRSSSSTRGQRKRTRIDTTPSYDMAKRHHKRQIVEQSKRKHGPQNNN